jgi:hypothetical protein
VGTRWSCAKVKILPRRERRYSPRFPEEHC